MPPRNCKKCNFEPLKLKNFLGQLFQRPLSMVRGLALKNIGPMLIFYDATVPSRGYQDKKGKAFIGDPPFRNT